MTAYEPYSPIRQAGGCYFISGQVGIDPNTKTADVNIVQQTLQALENLKAVLNQHGLDLNHVVKTTIFLKNMSDFDAMNNVYVTCFDEPRPARSCVEVASLPKLTENELLVEIEAVAYRT